MYNKGFYITNPVGNNVFSYSNRKNKKIYVPSIIELNKDKFSEISLQNEEKKIAFEDFDFDGKLISSKGLKNFYRIKWEGIDLVLFDNHNHAFYFWLEARNKGLIKDDAVLFHIDEHSDINDGGNMLNKPESYNMNKVFEFTNYTLNVGNYIIPAQNEGVIGEIIQIRNETNLKEYLESKKNIFDKDIILNLDLDFFELELSYIDYELKKRVILDIARRSKLITVATSPFFINQDLALNVFKDIFG